MSPTVVLQYFWRARALAAALFALGVTACASAAPPPEAVQHELVFTSGDVQLHGRLYTPASRGPYPTVLYVTGSGNYSLLTDPYAQNAARAFVARGMAVFVFDKRGVGQSGGVYAPSDLPGKTADVRAALDFLAQRAEVADGQVIVWALSQAGWFAPQAIEGRRDVRGLILVSPAGVNPLDHSAMFATRALVAAGVTGPDQDEALAIWRTLWRYLGDAQNHAVVRAAFEQAQARPWYAAVRASSAWEGLPADASGLLDPDALRRGWTERPDDYEWLREQTNYLDYAPVYRAIRHPVLLVYGSADTLISPVASRRVFEAAFAGSGNRDVTVTTYEAAGHGIQARGDPQNPMPSFLTQATDWGLAHFDRRG